MNLRQAVQELAHTESSLREPLTVLLGKTAGQVRIRRMVTVIVRPSSTHPDPTDPTRLMVTGRMAIEAFGTESAILRFRATVRVVSSALGGSDYRMEAFTPVRSVTGGGADDLIQLYEDAFIEAVKTNPTAVLGIKA